MTRRGRWMVFWLGAAGVGLLFALAVADLPPFGGADHPYRDVALPAAVRHSTANVVASVNFDLRGIDTLGEETILLASVVGAAALLRPSTEQSNRSASEGGRLLDAISLMCVLLLPVTLLIGLDLIAHGHLTPGGGFQGGVVLATGLHLLYLAGSYAALQRLRPLAWYEAVEGLSTAAFTGLGLAGLVAGGALLANVLPFGAFQQLFSAGTVPVLNAVVGAAVAGGMVVLLAQFLTEAMTPSEPRD